MPATFDLVSCTGLLNLSQLLRSRSYSKTRQSEIKEYVEIYLNLTVDCLLKENSQLDIVGQEMKESSADTFIPN